MVNFGQKKAHWALYAAVFVVAFCLRAYSVDFGYFNPDERINDAARVLTGDLVPTQHFYPPLNNYIIAVSLVALFGVGVLTDMWSSVGDFRQAYFDDPTPFYLAGRYVTAALSALVAPIAFDIARRVGLEPLKSLAVAAIVSVLPVAVMMGHISKGDSALATMCVAVFWACIARSQSQDHRRWDIVTGVTVALALSFKQSAVFFVGPMAIAMIIVLGRACGLRQTLKSLGLVVLVSVILFPILNIGIFLDFEAFLAFQDVQTVMSIKEEDGFGVGLPISFGIFGSVFLGLNPVFLPVAVVAPLWLISKSCGLEAKNTLFAAWIANVIGTLVISLIVGERQPDHLFLVQLNIFLILAAVVLMDMLSPYRGIARGLIGGVAVSGFGISLAGSIEVLRQAAHPPIVGDVVEYLTAEHGDKRIKTSLVLPVPKTLDAQKREHDRLIRLAEKYGIEPPSFQKERFIKKDAEDALYYSLAPFAMFGLEDDATIDEDYTVTLHTWPIQPEEWDLDNWIDEDFEIFVADNLDALMNESRSSHIRSFFRDIQARCALLQEFKGEKTLFLEYDVFVFDCSNA